MKNAMFFLIILVCASCKKNPTDKPLGDMSISKIEGLQYKGDSLAQCTAERSKGYFLSDNEIKISGANFGDEEGEISTTNADFEINVVEWNNDFIILKTDSKNYLTEFKDLTELTVTRSDGAKITKSINVINSLSEYAQNSPTWFLMSFFEGKVSILPHDFHTNMEKVEGDYEPELYDIVKQNGTFKIITTAPQKVENGDYTSYIFKVSYRDCNGKEYTENVIFNTLDGVIYSGQNAPEYYFRS